MSVEIAILAPTRPAPMMATCLFMSSASHPQLPLTVHCAHAPLRVALAGDAEADTIQCGKLVLRELDIDRGGILFDSLRSGGPGNRHDILASRQQPRKRELCRC